MWFICTGKFIIMFIVKNQYAKEAAVFISAFLGHWGFLNLNFTILTGVWDDFLLDYIINLIHSQ